ncbi:MAG TPA: hypothetical protein DEA43_03050 [Candidatus Moranbacteria bacterium]|nr:hypothetical protein [Candidatus Moranbacteria bacterium]HBT45833.1 hypothetical protein [Candidatus Moranbacteria bacterium]
MTLNLLMVLINLALMLVTVGVLIKIILRTEKGIDLAFKILIISPIVLLLASFLQMDKIMGVFSKEYAQIVFYASRFIANVAFLAASIVFLKTISKCKEN